MKFLFTDSSCVCGSIFTSVIYVRYFKALRIKLIRGTNHRYGPYLRKKACPETLLSGGRRDIRKKGNVKYFIRPNEQYKN